MRRELSKKDFSSLVSKSILCSLFASIFLCVLASSGDLPAGYVAKIGNRLITEDEFRDRYKTYLLFGADDLLARHRMLETLINEELLLQQAERQGLTKTQEFEREVLGIRQQVLLDQFRERIIGGRVVVNDSDLLTAFHRYNTKVAVRHIYASTEWEAWEYKRLLESGMRFEDLARSLFKDRYLSESGGFLGYIGFGDMDPSFEEAAFNLPVGRISDPVRTAYGYSILRVEDRVEHPLPTESDYLKARKGLKIWLRRMKMDREAIRYTDELKSRLGIEINRETLQHLMDTFVKWPLEREKPRERVQPVMRLNPETVLGETLVTFRGGRWTVEDFFEKAQGTSERQRNFVQSAAEMEKFITGLVVRDGILSEARAAGLESDPVVFKEIDRRVKNLTERKIFDEILSAIQISDGELQSWYEKYHHNFSYPDRAHVLEILVNSESIAEQLVSAIHAGEDFRKLASRHTMRQSSAQRGGDLGFVSRDRFGPHAEKIFSASVGSVVGPLPYGETFAVYKILGFSKGRGRTFEEAREEIQAQLKVLAQRAALQKTVNALKEQTVIMRDYDRIAMLNFRVSNLP